MTNTAPVSTTLADNGVALLPVTIGGVTLPAGSTPQQRLEAHAKAGTQSQFHTNGTAVRFAQGDGRSAEPGTIGNKAPPPTPQQLEAANKPQGAPSPARQAEVDAEQQRAGLQARPDGRTLAVGEFDQEAFDLLTERYKSIMHPGLAEAAAARFKAAYENDVKSLLEGRQLTGKQIAELRKSGNVETFVPKSKEAPPAAPANTGWQSHVEDGEWVGIEHLTTDDTSGFTIPHYVQGQRVNVAMLEQLKDAKAAGITQAQVNAVLQQHAVRNGWVKA